MKFGIAYEISVPRPWTRESEKTVYDRCLEQVKLADELGFDTIWAVEHHFLEEYSHCSSPELFLAACAMLTKRIRLGFGIVVCVPEYSSPIRIAERTANLDILSGGRVEVGTGRSAYLDRTRRLSRQPRRNKEDLGRVRPLYPEDVDAGALCIPGHDLVDAATDDTAQTVSEAASTALGRGYQSGHRSGRCRARDGQPRIDLRDPPRAGRKLTRYRRIIRDCQPVVNLSMKA
jgi:alkanesulfonate monooxygenase SsuD/methylene tetrahydromethanopterin reductase-like flavin-dependent oxidoreductase (luciferase family)